MAKKAKRGQWHRDFHRTVRPRFPVVYLCPFADHVLVVKRPNIDAPNDWRWQVVQRSPHGDARHNGTPVASGKALGHGGAVREAEQAYAQILAATAAGAA